MDSKRVEELAREAGIVAEPRFGLISTGNKQLERFAELIRADAALEAAQLSPNGLDVSGYDSPHIVWKKYSDGILAHFGIDPKERV